MQISWMNKIIRLHNYKCAQVILSQTDVVTIPWEMLLACTVFLFSYKDFLVSQQLHGDRLRKHGNHAPTQSYLHSRYLQLVLGR